MLAQFEGIKRQVPEWEGLRPQEPMSSLMRLSWASFAVSVSQEIAFCCLGYTEERLTLYTGIGRV